MNSLQNRFLEACKVDIPMELHLLRAHLFTEELLTEILRRTVSYPKRLEIDRFTYIEKLRIVSSLGRIPLELSKGLKQLNKLRNLLAHNLNREIYTTDVDELMKSLGPKAGKHIKILVDSNVNEETKRSSEKYYGNLFIATVAFIAGQLESIVDSF